MGKKANKVVSWGEEPELAITAKIIRKFLVYDSPRRALPFLITRHVSSICLQLFLVVFRSHQQEKMRNEKNKERGVEEASSKFN